MKTILYTDYDGINKKVEMTDLEYRAYCIWLQENNRPRTLELIRRYFNDLGENLNEDV